MLPRELVVVLRTGFEANVRRNAGTAHGVESLMAGLDRVRDGSHLPLHRSALGMDLVVDAASLENLFDFIDMPLEGGGGAHGVDCKVSEATDGGLLPAWQAGGAGGRLVAAESGTRELLAEMRDRLTNSGRSGLLILLVIEGVKLLFGLGHGGKEMEELCVCKICCCLL